MASEKKYTDAVLYDYAGDLLAAAAKPEGANVPHAVVLAIVQRYRELIDAERRRKGRPSRRPRVSNLGEMVEAEKAANGGNVTKARQAVALKKKTTVRNVAQAHLRWLKRRPVVRPT